MVRTYDATEARAASNRAACAPYFDQHLLSHLFGLRRIAQDTADEPVHAWSEEIVEAPERRFVAVRDRAQQCAGAGGGSGCRPVGRYGQMVWAAGASLSGIRGLLWLGYPGQPQCRSAQTRHRVGSVRRTSQPGRVASRAGPPRRPWVGVHRAFGLCRLRRGAGGDTASPYAFDRPPRRRDGKVDVDLRVERRSRGPAATVRGGSGGVGHAEVGVDDDVVFVVPGSGVEVAAAGD